MEGSEVITYKDIIVWQKAIDLVAAIYEATEVFLSRKMYGISQQMRKCAVSVPSNIAEGKGRGTRRDFCHFITIAFESGAELETQITIVKCLSFGKNIDFKQIDMLLTEVMRMLNKLRSSLQPKT